VGEVGYKYPSFLLVLFLPFITPRSSAFYPKSKWWQPMSARFAFSARKFKMLSCTESFLPFSSPEKNMFNVMSLPLAFSTLIQSLARASHVRRSCFLALAPEREI
jgi:hypothetical protein